MSTLNATRPCSVHKLRKNDVDGGDDAVLTEAESSLSTSVGKALALLDAFEHIDTSLGVSELARRTHLPKSTAFRLLAILEQRQLVERQGTRYRLGTRLFELGQRVSYCRPRSLRDNAVPFISDLYELTHETVHLGVLDGSDVLYLEKLFGHQRVKAPSAVGARVPAYCSALGKALLAMSEPDALNTTLARGLEPRTGYTIVVPSMLTQELQAVRARGVAFDREESSVGVNCVAAPIFARNGRLLGAVSVCGATGRFNPHDYAAPVLQAARGIGSSIAA